MGFALDRKSSRGGRAAGGVGSGRHCDVASIPPLQLKAWKSGGVEARQRAVTIERARRSFGRLMLQGGKAWVCCPEGNGRHPVLLLAAPGFQREGPFRVHTHFHGWNSTVAEPAGHPAGLTLAILERFRIDPQTLYVLPECANVPTNTRAVWPGVQTVTVETDWSNVRDQAQATRDTLAAAGLSPEHVTEWVVSAHSGGGRALGYAVQHVEHGRGLEASRLELYDCLYSAPPGTLSARQAIKDWLRTPAGEHVKSVAYFEGDGGNGEKADRELLNLLGPRFFKASGYTHNACIALNFGK